MAAENLFGDYISEITDKYLGGKYRVLNVPYIVLKEKIDAVGVTHVINAVHDLVISGGISFPYKKLFIDIDVQKQFQSLCKYVPNVSTDAVYLDAPKGISRLMFGKPCSIVHAGSEYLSSEILSDLYNEPIRMTANVIGKISPASYWTAAAETLTGETIAAVLKGDFDALSTYSFREMIYKLSYECNSFKPAAVVGVVKLLRTGGYSLSTMLDISAGWGDRIIGAMAAGMTLYTGYDPNEALRPGHTAIISAFAQPGQTAEVIYEPFEKVKITRTYDIVFSSIPYFNYEIYTDSPGQSAGSTTNLDDWKTNFFVPAVKKAENALRKGGLLCMHLSNIKDCRLVDMLFATVSCKYLGVISSMQERGKPRPIWIFERME